MFFRFAVIVVALIGLALAGISLEKQNLALRRTIATQEYVLQQLQTQRARLRLEVGRLSAPQELIERTAAPPQKSPEDPARRPRHGSG